MGVAGCGKSTIGKALAEHLGWDFFDADDFHPPENITKMTAGIPLDDDDRDPWLNTLHNLIADRLRDHRPAVLACSALKERYRLRLLANNPGVQLVYLQGSYDVIRERLAARPDHYMKPAMLRSQFAALEEPADALTIDVTLPVAQAVARIAAFLK